MRIDNAQLSAFAAVVSEGTFDLAARKLHVTASAISQRIKLLEDRLGQVLIQRSTPCQPTAAGRVVLRYATAMQLLEAEMLAGLGVPLEGSAATVRLPIAVNADSLDSWFSEVFQAVAQHGGIALDVRTEDQDHSVTLLREGAVMGAVSANAQALQGCSVEPLGVMRYWAVASPAFVAIHFAQGVRAKALQTAPMLNFNRKDALQGLFLQKLTSVPVQPPVHWVPSTHAFMQAACAGLAWGMVPQQMAAPAVAAGILQHLAPRHRLDVPLYWHRWRLGSHALDALSGMVRQAAAHALG